MDGLIRGRGHTRKRTLVNFLVNSRKGIVFLRSIDASDISKVVDKIEMMLDDVVEEIGEENVVQVVIDNALNYKAAGDLLMAKRKNMYWTSCTSHCIDLMLEDFEKKLPLHQETITAEKRSRLIFILFNSLVCLLHKFTKGGDLTRPNITRFATSYLTLGCLHDNKGSLIRMAASDEWRSSPFSKTRDDKSVEDLIFDKELEKYFELHLIKVLRLVDTDEKLAMGFIYEAMDHTEEDIQKAFKGVSRSYMPLWNIIDERWDNQLHRPLHAAGYYLNPMMHYSPNFKVDYEVKKGLYDCLGRFVGDIQEIGKIDAQVEDFKSKKGFFGSAIPTPRT